MAFLAGLAPFAAPVGSLLGGLFGASSARKGAQIAAQGQQEANIWNARIADSTNAANIQMTRETNAAQQALANSATNFNASQALQQMDFQREMSGTAHQREVADLQAAGLNPVLSGMGGGGASTPSGASGSAVMPTLNVPRAQPYTVANTKAEFANTGRALAQLYSNTGSSIGEGLAKAPFIPFQLQGAALNNKMVMAQIDALQANSAQARALQPFWDQIGSLSPKVAAAVGDYVRKWNQQVPAGPGHQPPAGLPEIPAPGEVPGVLQSVPQDAGRAVGNFVLRLISSVSGGGSPASPDVNVPNSAKSFDAGRFSDSQRSNAGGLNADVLRRYVATQRAKGLNP